MWCEQFDSTFTETSLMMKSHLGPAEFAIADMAIDAIPADERLWVPQSAECLVPTADP